MKEKPVSLSPRKEDVRDKKEVANVVVQFDLEEIKQHFYDSLNDIKKQFAVAESLLSSGRQEEAMDVWRSQVVFVEGVMDFFMHEISKYALIKMFKGDWEKSERYANLMIPMSTVEEGLRNPESTEWLLSRLNSRFSQEVYLSSDALSSQLSLIGMRFDDICKIAFPKQKNESNDSGKQKLRDLYARRNQIAHQIDRQHATAEKKPIDKQFVEDAIATVTAFVEGVCSTAATK
ncbi:MAG: hypothetical protein IJM54_04815 [Thermoguttaceae bacterium]|nr:hypothetical protein [Thermoguttaceae bacterium]